MNESSEQALFTGLDFVWGALSDKGKEREENEDAYVVEPEIGLFVVSDGMGGHRGGALASQIVIEDLPVRIETRLHKLRSVNVRSIRRIIESSVIDQSKELYSEGLSESGYKDMGATVAMAMLYGDRAYICNLGDSRIFRFRKGHLFQVSRDHSVVGELLSQGKLENHEIHDHEAAGQITHYVGMEEKAIAHTRSFKFKKGDRLLLCTDGLTDVVDEHCIAKILLDCSEPNEACRRLVSAANKAGGHDNITAVVIDWVKNRKL
jgi:serine/threonine protein phosphatase PrpC